MEKALALYKARKYIMDAAQRNVLAISPQAIAGHVGCDEVEAKRLLFALQDEHLVAVKGFITCDECSEHVGLKSGAISDLIEEATRQSQQPCPHCSNTLPDSAHARVQLSFFYSAAGQAAAAMEQATAGRDISLAELRSLGQSVTVTGPGAQVLVNSTQNAAGPIGGVHRDTTTTIETRAATAGGSPMVAQPAPSASAQWWTWPSISLAVGSVVGVVSYWRMPDSWPRRLDLAILAALAAFMVAIFFNPAGWRRRMVGAVVMGWLAVRGIGLTIFADTQFGRFLLAADATVPGEFDIAVAAVVIAILYLTK